ncbi:hypothetical protein Glove_410g108 [Diversispora epigaea]|uniref:Uncharacterized protein n=1 Tax=Diversispora epigaea TaxID=1348612 RepID=A0A397H368_9GLOM|nr:hypothetical protein Glove_410g108 [Diversispora epigaea]
MEREVETLPRLVIKLSNPNTGDNLYKAITNAISQNHLHPRDGTIERTPDVTSESKRG